jgi:hypothetical protein
MAGYAFHYVSCERLYPGQTPYLMKSE